MFQILFHHHHHHHHHHRHRYHLFFPEENPVPRSSARMASSQIAPSTLVRPSIVPFLLSLLLFVIRGLASLFYCYLSLVDFVLNL
ncbi:unnamed protein product [Kuraishia capsulata CBS 1993]|uniref:Uncharacterized protein n=1 Tax=Kuraishia capsulata CBS 1993 TaxID=1382522 RepID=W6MP87_9ASCO|nr:uncharacterized protein KUCA_T00004433001 [Kuraishia capsulata CBS 1993]CDK28451.1 unnamed protein product [Kuraishia capsulata CBS 1993]